MPESSHAGGGPDPTDPIVCRTTPWYTKRMGLMFLMIAAFSGWFLWDGLVKYPRQIEIYDAFTDVTKRSEVFRELEASGRAGEWPAIAAERGWSADPPPDWTTYSHERGWPEKPEKREPGDVVEQMVFSGILGATALVVLVVFLVNRNRTLRADATSFTTPGGVRVPFDQVFRVDKRKWQGKGLAYAHFRDEGGANRKATLDDLKFDGADRILDRLLANFEGELIDRIEAPTSEDDEGAESPAPEPSEREADDPGKT